MDFDALRQQVRQAFKPLAGPCEFTEHERVRHEIFGHGTIVGVSLTSIGEWVFRLRFDDSPGQHLYVDAKRARNIDGTFPFRDALGPNEVDLLTGVLKLDVVSQLGDLLHGDD